MLQYYFWGLIITNLNNTGIQNRGLQALLEPVNLTQKLTPRFIYSYVLPLKFLEIMYKTKKINEWIFLLISRREIWPAPIKLLQQRSTR